MLNPDGSDLHNPRAQAPGAAYNIFTSEHSLEDKAFFLYKLSTMVHAVTSSE